MVDQFKFYDPITGRKIHGIKGINSKELTDFELDNIFLDEEWI